MSSHDGTDANPELNVAIIGMAGRFPGAGDIHKFWQNLRQGVEAISIFDDQQMLAFGVDPAALRDAAFVKAGALLDDSDMFDAAFFGYSPREAEMLDPQHRIFLECAWAALEDAGYDPERYPDMIGVFAGSSLSTYLLFNLLTHQLDAHDSFQAMISNDKDFLSTRVAYELNLKGPSVSVQTACSTSLTAVHLACQSLLSYQCDMALAGGVCVQVPQRTGYYYQPGGITSSDGHCRAFDARAEGTIFGNGAGIVVLKREADALADGDHLYAVIRGSAINNDGFAKIGYTAPSIEGQAQVIEIAQLLAGIAPESISYVEAHGTATALGDPAEVEALTRAFRKGRAARHTCALGSVKSNIGHLDAAAGVAGLIKTTLALYHKEIPPSLHYEQPNPRIDFANSPFYVNTALKPWPAGETPRRAGVSSFGIGGSNAHVIVEEAPLQKPAETASLWQLLTISAGTEAALQTATANLFEHLQADSAVNLADVAYTLQVGRKRFNYRRAIVAEDVEEALEGLSGHNPQRVTTVYQEASQRPVVFMFPGGGAQHIDMAKDLYEQVPVFREHLDACADLLKDELGYAITSRIFPGDRDRDTLNEQIKQTSVGLPALFAVEYALAEMWMSWGVRPHAMIGHSLGEYVAACLAGVFSLADALSLVCARAALFEQLPRGAMLSVPMPESELLPLLEDGLAIAANNGPSQCVVSGTVEAIERIAALLSESEIEYRKLQIDVAAHSPLVTPILDAFAQRIEPMELREPTIPYLSNVTGDWITGDEATSPEYWTRHLRQTVRFADGLQRLAENPDHVLLEVGPGQTLTTLAKMQPYGIQPQSIIASMRHPYDRDADCAVLLAALGRLWQQGVEIDWPAYHRPQPRRRLALPTYSFQRQRYWIAAGQSTAAWSPAAADSGKRPAIGDWFYAEGWRRTPAVRVAADSGANESKRWLVLSDEEGIGEEIGRQLRQRGEALVEVRPRNGAGAGEYEEVLAAAEREMGGVDAVLDVRSMREREGEDGEEQERGLYSLLSLIQAIDRLQITHPIRLVIVTSHLLSVESDDIVYPERATLLGLCKVAPQEFENVDVCLIDVALRGAGLDRKARIVEQILAETATALNGDVVAYRKNYRYVQSYEPVSLANDGDRPGRLKAQGVYLITGGLGGVGLLLASYLGQTLQARLVLVQRSAFLGQEEWDNWLATHDESDATSRKIIALRALQAVGSEVTIAAADVASESQMQAVVDQVIARYGRIDGVIHAAGQAGEQALRLIPEITRQDCELQFRAKIAGLQVLEKVLDARPPDFCLLISSNAAILGGLGSLVYTAANSYMDAFAVARSDSGPCQWISANWDGWLQGDRDRLSEAHQTTLDRYAMTPRESVEAFRRVVDFAPAGQLIVSTGSLPLRHDLWVRRKGRDSAAADQQAASTAAHPRPELTTDYLPPETEIEAQVAEIWQRLLGVARLGINDNFFELGGNSLICLKVIATLKKELHVDLPVVAIFEAPTVKALAHLISNNGAGESTNASSRDRGERRREKRRRQQQSAGSV